MLELVLAFVHGRSLGQETPIGWTPRYNDIEWSGMDFPEQKFDELIVRANTGLGAEQD